MTAGSMFTFGDSSTISGSIGFVGSSAAAARFADSSENADVSDFIVRDKTHLLFRSFRRFLGLFRNFWGHLGFFRRSRGGNQLPALPAFRLFHIRQQVISHAAV